MPRAAPVTSALRGWVTIAPRPPSKEGTMTDRWFSPDELEQLSRPTMDRAIEAIDAGELDRAKALCGEMKHEWQMLHDLMAGGRPRPRLLHPAAAGRGGRGRSVDGEHGPRLAPASRRDQLARPAQDRRAARRHMARALLLGRRPESRQLHDQRGRGEGQLLDEPLRLGPATGAQRRLRGPARRRRHPGGPRLVLRPQGLPALLHPLQLHERVAADPVVGLSALPLRTARGLLQGPLRLALVQGPRGRSPSATGAATARSSPTGPRAR